MALQSIHDVHSPASSRSRDFPSIIPPLALAPHFNDSPKLILGIVVRPGQHIITHPMLARDPDGSCTHINARLFTGDKILPAWAFGAVSAAMTWRNNHVEHIHPELKDEFDRTYGTAGKLSVTRKLTNGCWKWIVPGEVYDESWRACDSFIYVDLKKPRQVENVLERVMEWKDKPPQYQVAGWERPNCLVFAEDLMKAADIKLEKPFGSRMRPWPFAVAEHMEKQVDKGVRAEGPFTYVGKRDVADMFEAVKGRYLTGRMRPATLGQRAQQVMAALPGLIRRFAPFPHAHVLGAPQNN